MLNPDLEEIMTTRTFLILTIMLAGLATSACNTLSGAGRDMSSLGHAVTDTANDAKRGK